MICCKIPGFGTQVPSPESVVLITIDSLHQFSFFMFPPLFYRFGTLRCGSVVWGSFWAKGNRHSVCSGETSLPSLKYLQRFELGDLLIIRDYQRKPVYVAGQTTDYWTCTLCAMTCWSPQVPYLIPSSECHIHPCSLSVSEPLMHMGSLTLSCIWGSHTYVHIKFGCFLLLICLIYLIIRPAKRTRRVEESFFLPHKVIYWRKHCHYMKVFLIKWSTSKITSL